MRKDPKTIAGIVAAVLLAAGIVILLVFLVPLIGEYSHEASLTPTPLPPVPASVMMVTPDPAAPTAEPVLRKSAQGEEVTKLQNRLSDLGYYKSEVDGQFGPGTEEAVKAFQRANGLEADGIVGPETRERLYSDEAIPFSAGN